MIKRGGDYDSWLDLPAGVYFEVNGNTCVKLKPSGESGGIAHGVYSKNICTNSFNGPSSSSNLSFIAPEFFD